MRGGGERPRPPGGRSPRANPTGQGRTLAGVLAVDSATSDSPRPPAEGLPTRQAARRFDQKPLFHKELGSRNELTDRVTSL